MFNAPKIIVCPPGVWTKIIHTRFAQLPMSWKLESTDDPSTLGELEETKSSWIFPGTPTLRDMPATIILSRGYWNTFYKVRIRPLRQISVRLQRYW